jgi:heme-degrading monooxygenase HmoA
MHAVVVHVTVNDREKAITNLRDEVVPQVSSAPGFKAGYWVAREGDRGLSLLVFESEEAARAASEQIPQRDDAVTFDSVELGEVVASA